MFPLEISRETQNRLPIARGHTKQLRVLFIGTVLLLFKATADRRQVLQRELEGVEATELHASKSRLLL